MQKRVREKDEKHCCGNQHNNVIKLSKGITLTWKTKMQWQIGPYFLLEKKKTQNAGERNKEKCQIQKKSKDKDSERRRMKK